MPHLPFPQPDWADDSITLPPGRTRRLPPGSTPEPETGMRVLASSGRLRSPHGVDGTSSSEHSRQRPGDGASPGVLSGAKITPEPPEERRSRTGPAGRTGSGAEERAAR